MEIHAPYLSIAGLWVRMTEKEVAVIFETKICKEDVR